MSFRKFNVGDLVFNKSRRSYWKDRIGLIVRIEYNHGDAAHFVKWRGIEKMKHYHQHDLRFIE